MKLEMQNYFNSLALVNILYHRGLFPPKPYSYVNIGEVNVFLVWTVKSLLSLCS